jgi:hypothetical protein
MSAETCKRASPDVVCVLGMHRSGTSAVARVLDLLGVDFGPREHLYAARADNPEGFFEHKALVEMSDEILRRLGGSWHERPVFPPGWELSPLLSDIRKRAVSVIREDFSERPLWGWKDPRACLTLPFWRSLLPRTCYVLCVRSPLSVARSLELRDGFPIRKSGRLWLDYMASALTQTAGERRMIVAYEDLVASREPEVRRILQFIDRRDEASEMTAQAPRPDLEHHRTSLAETLSERELPFGTRMLYLGLVLTPIRARVNLAPPDEMDAAINLLTETIVEEQTPSDEREADPGRLLDACRRLLVVQERLRAEQEGLRVERDGFHAEVERLRTEVTRYQAASAELGDHPVLRAYRSLRFTLLPHGSWREAAYMRARRWLGTRRRSNL